MAGLIDAMSQAFEVVVLSRGDLSAAPPTVQTHSLTARRKGSVAASISIGPRIPRRLFGSPAEARDVVHQIRPAAVWFSHSYMAAWFGLNGRFLSAVDFQNIEASRFWSIARTSRRPSAALEAIKARRWERQVASRASIVSAINAADHEHLRRWTAQKKAFLVPNAASTRRQPPSSTNGPITFVASFDYLPNRDAAGWLTREVWPRVLAVAPNARLRIVGRSARSLEVEDSAVEVCSDVVSIEPFYRDASIVVAPTRSGGGAQLKVTEALGAGRVVVATAFSERAIPPSPGLLSAGSAEEFASHITYLLSNVEARHRLEADLTELQPASWMTASQVWLDALRELTI